MEMISIRPGKNRTADKEPLQEPSFFPFKDLKWFQMLLGMTNRSRISTATSSTDDHYVIAYKIEYKSIPLTQLKKSRG